MTRTELARALATRRGLPRAEAARVVSAVLEGIEEALCEGRRVEVRGFGTLRPRHYPGYIGRNPRDGGRVVVGPKVLPVYRPGRALLARLAQREE